MAFIIPFFFLYFTPLQLGADNYSKYFLLSVFALCLTLLFFIKQIFKGGLKIDYSPLDLPLLFFLLIFLISSIWGADRFAAFFGNLNNTEISFFAFFILYLLYVLFFNILKTREKIISIFQILLFSFSFLSLLAFVILFFYNLQNWAAYLRLAIGTAEDLSIYLVYFIIFYLSLLSSNSVKKELFLKNNIGLSSVFRIFCNFIVFLTIILLIRIDFFYAWWLLFGGMLLVAAVRLIFFKVEKELNTDINISSQIKGKKKKRGLIIPIILALISLNFLLNFYLVLGYSSLDNRLSQYRQLSNFDSLNLAKNTLSDNLLFGVGLENFDYAYSMFRNKAMNSYKYWDIRYNKAGNFFLNLTISGGLLGAISFLFIIFVIGRYYYKIFGLFKNNQKQKNFFQDSILELTIILFPIIMVMIVNLFIYSITANSLFLLVLFLAIFMSASRAIFTKFALKQNFFAFGSYNINYHQDKNHKLFVYFGFGLFLVFGIVFLSYNLKFLIGDMKFGFQDRKEFQLQRSASLSSFRYQHDLELAKLFLEKFKLNQKKGNLQDSLDFQEKAMRYARLSQNLGLNSVVAQETAGAIYRDFSQGNDGNNQLAIKAFKSAFDLEPSNPVISTEIGQLLLKRGDYEQAEVYFRKSLDLKSDYKLAELGLAKSLISKGESQIALDILEKLAKNTKDPSVYYELGLLHFNENRIEESQAAFNTAVTLSPLYANALFGLALTFEKNGEIDQALYYLRKIQRLNPANQEVTNKIKELNKIK